MIKTCIICGKEFDAYCSTAKVCSDACRKEKDRESGRRAYQKKCGDKFNDWLTIPDAPNYEINSALQVRNKKTGSLKTPNRTGREKKLYYLLYQNKKAYRRSNVTLRHQAEAAVSDIEWYPVPSLNNLYEFNQFNQLRNVKTKKLIVQNTRKCFGVHLHGKGLSTSVLSLRWEIFGEIPPYGSHVRKAIIIRKGETMLYFERFIDAANFLAAELFFSVSNIQRFFNKRQPEIYGWRINYLEDERPEVGVHLKGMQKNDPRPK